MTDAINFDDYVLGDAPEPAQLIRGLYGAKLENIELGASALKHTPYFQFVFKTLEVKEVDEDALEEAGGGGELVNKQARSDRFWISEKALFNLARFVKGVGIDYAGELRGKNLSESRELLAERLDGEELDIFVVRQPVERSDGSRAIDEEGNPITRAVVSSVRLAA